MKKKTHLTSRKKHIFFTSFFELILLLCISKMISRAWEGVTITFLNHSKWRRIEKDLPKCFGHRMGQVYTIKVANQNQYFVTRQPKNNLIYDFKYQKHPKLVIRTTFTFYFFIPLFALCRVSQAPKSTMSSKYQKKLCSSFVLFMDVLISLTAAIVSCSVAP